MYGLGTGGGGRIRSFLGPCPTGTLLGLDGGGECWQALGARSFRWGAGEGGLGRALLGERNDLWVRKPRID